MRTKIIKIPSVGKWILDGTIRRNTLILRPNVHQTILLYSFIKKLVENMTPEAR